MQENDSVLLKPGSSIKPSVESEDVRKLAREVYGLNCITVTKLNGYDDFNFHICVEKENRSTGDNDNIYIDQICQDGYVLKIINSLDSKNTQFFDAQNALLRHLDRKNICCPRPVPTINGEYYICRDFRTGRHLVRLLEFINGSVLNQVPSTYELFYQVGKYAAELDSVLKTFSHPAYTVHKTIWMLESTPELQQFLFAVNNPVHKVLVEDVIHEFIHKVLRVSGSFGKGVIHGDFNEHNIIVDRRKTTEDDGRGRWYVKGVLDLGDSQYGCYLYELAITMTYMMLKGRHIDVGGHVLAGYCAVVKLPLEELKLLKICTAARLCQSLVMGAYSSLNDPENAYILDTANFGWTLLERIWLHSDDDLFIYWQNIADKVYK